jgi:hypothetical protein
LDGAKKNVSAQSVFVDPIADIAVLSLPDEQDFPDEYERYCELVDESGAPNCKSTERQWMVAPPRRAPMDSDALHLFRGWCCTSLETGPTEAAMSGSPIVNDREKAIGVVSIGCTTNANGKRHDEKARPQPILTDNLPGWLL